METKKGDSIAEDFMYQVREVNKKVQGKDISKKEGMKQINILISMADRIIKKEEAGCFNDGIS
jgi:hypothetical protein